MKRYNLALLTFCLTAALVNSCYIKSTHKSPYKWTPPNVDPNDIPAAYTWGNVDGVNYLTQSKNQHIPQYCGSCWAQGSTSSVSDRISIMRKAAFPEINIAVQPIMDCDHNDYGCQGGDAVSAFAFIHDNGITDETCAPYLALSWREGRTCTDTSHCKECSGFGQTCTEPAKYNKYQIGEYGSISGEADMMQEILTRGPIACGVDAGPLEGFEGDTIITTKGEGIDHIISVVGWGIEAGQKYWILRNSWGEYFGDEGYAKVAKGNGGAINIEEDCSYAVPIDTWSGEPFPHATAEKKEETMTDLEKKLIDLLYSTPVVKEQSFEYVGLLNDFENPHAFTDLPDEVIKSPRPEDYVNDVSLPDAFWWGNNNGVNYHSWTVNQHVPQYCGSCWAQAAEAALADRINIKHNNGFPRVALSVQQILNCAAGGTCHGGSLNGVYQFGHTHYLVEFGCRIYEAKDPASGATCSDIQNCINCSPGSRGCFAQPDGWRKWYVSEYGRVVGKAAMMKEIFARGPITCGMHVTGNFYNNYKGGIYSEKTTSAGANHAVSVVGWGKENDVNYWIVRNTWGTWWGESGFFRINMDVGSLGIGTNSCYWAVPTLNKP